MEKLTLPTFPVNYDYYLKTDKLRISKKKK